MQVKSNPYNPPADLGSPKDAHSLTVRRIKIPTTALIALISIQVIGYFVAGLIGTIAAFKGARFSFSILELLISAFHLLLMLFMLRAMLQIRRLQGLRNGRIAAGLACIPVLSPWIWIGIPFGFWLTVVLAKSETANAFASPID